MAQTMTETTTVVWFGKTPEWDHSDLRCGPWPKTVSKVVLLSDGEVWSSYGGYDCEGQSVAYNSDEELAYGSPIGRVLQHHGYLPRLEKTETVPAGD